MDREIVPVRGEMLTPSQSHALTAEMDNIPFDDSFLDDHLFPSDEYDGLSISP